MEETFPSQKHRTFDEIVDTFVSRHKPKVALACVGVAGPVKDGRCEATNLPWVVDAAELARELGIARAWLLNDLEAYAYGIAALGPEDVVVLNEGAADVGATGACGRGHRPRRSGISGLDGLAPVCERGGHTDFAPTNELEIELLRYLLQRHERVSWERLVSGMGLVNIYRFLKETVREDEPAGLPRRGGPKTRAPSSSARPRRPQPPARQGHGVSWSSDGAEAGDLALKMMATVGVYVGGGIAPKGLERIKEGAFLRRFFAKGRMSALMESMPVSVILNEKTGLRGCCPRRLPAREPLILGCGGRARMEGR